MGEKRRLKVTEYSHALTMEKIFLMSMLQKNEKTNINFFVIDERPSKCSYFPLQHCGNSLFDLCQNHSSKTNFFQHILVENNKIQKTENREGIQKSKRTEFYHFY